MIFRIGIFYQILCKIQKQLILSMSYGKVIRVSDKTIQMLEKHRQGFETPDQCIYKILTYYNENKNKKKTAKLTIKRIRYDDGRVVKLV